MVTSRGNILHVMVVIEEHCTLYKLLALGFICSSGNKEAVKEVQGGADGKNKQRPNRTGRQICKRTELCPDC